MKPTPFEDLNEVLGELVDGIRQTLGSNVVGIYLQGSFAVGGFDEHSDADFIVVLDRQLTSAEVDRLNAMHKRIFHSGPEWAKHLEGSYFPRDVLEAEPGARVWYLDHGSQELEESNHCNTLLVRWTLERHGIALYGPEARAVVDPVPTEKLRREMLGTLRNWGNDILQNPEPYANRFFQGFVVLSYCRMLHGLQVGAVGSKAEGAEWAKQNLPPEWHGLIDRAWTCRPDPEASSRTPADPEDFAATLAFVRFAIEQSRILYPADGGP
jgi:hypothetical protein